MEKYAPTKVDLAKAVKSIRYANLGQDLRTTYDFPDTDPWFNLLADCIEAQPERFAGRKYLEFGIGGGLQAVAALTGLGKKPNLPLVEKIIGIDIDGWRLDIAAQNLDRFTTVPYILYQGDAVKWIEQQEKIANTAIVICLPQAPLPKLQLDQVGLFDSNADVYHEDKLPEFAKKYNRYGLGLNVAVLGRLIEHIADGTDVSVIFSGRVPENVIRDMISNLRWRIVDIIETPEPIQQDPDTDIGYVINYANESPENLFWEKLSNGIFGPISADEAEKRLLLADRNRNNLNVYHHVAVWYLEPAINYNS